MPKRVNIKGVGVVNFPDDMDEAGMQQAIETEISPSLTLPKGKGNRNASPLIPLKEGDNNFEDEQGDNWNIMRTRNMSVPAESKKINKPERSGAEKLWDDVTGGLKRTFVDPLERTGKGIAEIMAGTGVGPIRPGQMPGAVKPDENLKLRGVKNVATGMSDAAITALLAGTNTIANIAAEALDIPDVSVSEQSAAGIAEGVRKMLEGSTRFKLKPEEVRRPQQLIAGYPAMPAMESVGPLEMTAGALETAMGAITPTSKFLNLLAKAGPLAEESEAARYAMAPMTEYFKPTTEEGQYGALIGDFALPLGIEGMIRARKRPPLPLRSAAFPPKGERGEGKLKITPETTGEFIPPSFRKQMLRQLVKQGEDLVVTSKLSDAQLEILYNEKGLNKPAAADEAPGSEGRGAANQAQIDKFVAEGRMAPFAAEKRGVSPEGGKVGIPEETKVNLPALEEILASMEGPSGKVTDLDVVKGTGGKKKYSTADPVEYPLLRFMVGRKIKPENTIDVKRGRMVTRGEYYDTPRVFVAKGKEEGMTLSRAAEQWNEMLPEGAEHLTDSEFLEKLNDEAFRYEGKGPGKKFGAEPITKEDRIVLSKLSVEEQQQIKELAEPIAGMVAHKYGWGEGDLADAITGVLEGKGSELKKLPQRLLQDINNAIAMKGIGFEMEGMSKFVSLDELKKENVYGVGEETPPPGPLVEGETSRTGYEAPAFAVAGALPFLMGTGNEDVDNVLKGLGTGSVAVALAMLGRKKGLSKSEILAKEFLKEKLKKGETGLVEKQQKVKTTDVETVHQADLNSARELKAQKWKELQLYREKLKNEPLGANRRGLQIDIVRLKDQYEKAKSREQQALQEIEKRANELGQTTKNILEGEAAGRVQGDMFGTGKPAIEPEESMTAFAQKARDEGVVSQKEYDKFIHEEEKLRSGVEEAALNYLRTTKNPEEARGVILRQEGKERLAKYEKILENEKKVLPFKEGDMFGTGKPDVLQEQLIKTIQTTSEGGSAGDILKPTEKTTELPAHLAKLVKNNPKFKKPDYSVEEIKTGYEPEGALNEAGNAGLERLKGETLEQAVNRNVGYQIENGRVKLEEGPEGWKATVAGTEEPTIITGIKKQDVMNRVYKVLGVAAGVGLGAAAASPLLTSPEGGGNDKDGIGLFAAGMMAAGVMGKMTPKVRGVFDAMQRHVRGMYKQGEIRGGQLGEALRAVAKEYVEKGDGRFLPVEEQRQLLGASGALNRKEQQRMARKDYKRQRDILEFTRTLEKVEMDKLEGDLKQGKDADELTLSLLHAGLVTENVWNTIKGAVREKIGKITVGDAGKEIIGAAEQEYLFKMVEKGYTERIKRSREAIFSGAYGMGPDMYALNSGGVEKNPFAKWDDLSKWRMKSGDLTQNLEKAAGKDWPLVKRLVVDPLDDAKAKWSKLIMDTVKKEDDLVGKELKIKPNSDADAAVQNLAEGFKFFEFDKETGRLLNDPKFFSKLKGMVGIGRKSRLPVGETDPAALPEWLKSRLGDEAKIISEKERDDGNVGRTILVSLPYTIEDVASSFGRQRAQQIAKAAEFYKNDVYGPLFRMINRVRETIYTDQPKKLLQWRQRYMRHFNEEAKGFAGLLNIFEHPELIDPKLSGTSGWTEPRTKFQSFFQKRFGVISKESARGGFRNYLPNAAHSIHIDPQIEHIRQVAKIIEGDTEKSKNLNNLVLYLKHTANDLAGKTNSYDRGPMDWDIGRDGLRALNWANQRVKANSVMLNIGSISKQLLPVVNGYALLGKGEYNVLPEKWLSMGVRDMMKDLMTGDLYTKESNFFRERYISEAFGKYDTGVGGGMRSIGNLLMAFPDKVGLNILYHAFKAKAIERNMPDPVRFANNMTRQSVGGRGLGEMTLADKSKVKQLAISFMREVRNSEVLLWDNKTNGAFMARLILGGWAATYLYKQLGLDASLFDPITAVSDAIDIINEEDDAKEAAIRVSGRMAGEIIGTMPSGQLLTMALMDKYDRKKFFGKSDPSRFGSIGVLPDVSRLALKQLTGRGREDDLLKLGAKTVTPYGGNQLLKTYKGLAALKEGGVENDTDFESFEDILDQMRAVTLGPGQTQAARRLYGNE